MAVTLLIADDYEVFREGCSKGLDAKPGLRVVGEACNGEEAVCLAKRLKPDVVLMDVVMEPGIDGIEATRRILSESGGNARVLLLATFVTYEHVRRASRTGARGIRPKKDSFAELARITKAVATMDAEFWPYDWDPVLKCRRSTSDVNQLTNREVEVLNLVKKGCTNAGIASCLFIAEGTVKAYVHSVFRKLDVKNRTSAVKRAEEEGLID